MRGQDRDTRLLNDRAASVLTHQLLAKKLNDDAVRVAPNDPDIVGELAFLQMTLGDRDGAIAGYRRVLALYPGREDAFFHLRRVGGGRCVDRLRRDSVTCFGYSAGRRRPRGIKGPGSGATKALVICPRLER